MIGGKVMNRLKQEKSLTFYNTQRIQWTGIRGVKKHFTKLRKETYLYS